jgi:hypothetical protein
MPGKEQHHSQTDHEREKESGDGGLQDKGISPLTRFAGVLHYNLADARPLDEQHGQNPLSLRCILR